MPHRDRSGAVPLLLFVLLTAACGRRPLSATELDAYLKDPAHGCTAHRSLGGYDLELTYRPVTLIAYPELQRGEQRGLSRDSILARYAGLVHFILRAQLDGTDVVNALIARRGMGDHGGMIGQGLQAHARLVTCRDSIAPALVYYPRLYEMASRSEILLAFPTPADSACGTWEVLLQDGLPGLPPLHFTFDPADIARVPEPGYISDLH